MTSITSQIPIQTAHGGEHLTLIWIASPLAITLIIMTVYLCRSLIEQERTIKSQQETIQRLINHEPVTYTEVGQEPTLPEKEFYSAWGNETVAAKDLD